jgi:hypothetical protein
MLRANKGKPSKPKPGRSEIMLLLDWAADERVRRGVLRRAGLEDDGSAGRRKNADAGRWKTSVADTILDESNKSTTPAPGQDEISVWRTAFVWDGSDSSTSHLELNSLNVRLHSQGFLTCNDGSNVQLPLLLFLRDVRVGTIPSQQIDKV